MIAALAGPTAMPAQFLKFGLVGVVGFGIDAGALFLLITAGDLGPYVGRIYSFLIAASVTWVLHRHFTFKSAARGPAAGQWVRFVAVNGFGGAVNYGIYAALLLTSETFLQAPVLAVAVGSLAAWAFNFFASRRYVFKAAYPDRADRSAASSS